jgi:glycosyltransferase involved in cell wall biosynthesis
VNVYWYWPFLRREELVITAGALRAGDRLVVHTTDRDDDPIVSGHAQCEVWATLPGVRDHSEGSVRWALSRSTTYLTRADLRRRAITSGRFDVAHVVYLNPFTDAVALAALERRLPLVSSVHDVVPHHSRVPPVVERRLLEAQYRHAGMLITHHEAVRRRLLAEFPVDPARVVVIPLPITELAPMPPGASDDLPTPGSVPTVLFFGTFRRNKGIDVLLDAIAAFPRATPARFVFAGRGFTDMERRIRDAARVDPRIAAEIGYVPADRKHRLHATADLMVLPYTTFASQSAVLQDAYSHRLPLLVSDVGALGETVRADRTGWVVPPGDVDALGDALVTALGDAPARHAAAAAADVVARDRTPTRIGAQWRALYARVAR